MNKSYYYNMFSPAMNIFSRLINKKRIDTLYLKKFSSVMGIYNRGELSFSRLIVLILEKWDI